MLRSNPTTSSMASTTTLCMAGFLHILALRPLVRSSEINEADVVTHSHRIHRAWLVAVAAFIALVGAAPGTMAPPFVAAVPSRWFVHHRGLVSGTLTAAGAAGQLVFLPLLAALAMSHGWRAAALLVAGSALAVVPIVLVLLRDHPS